nr:MAG TPA: hypothetical protein [Caudoviricetes sp.]
MCCLHSWGTDWNCKPLQRWVDVKKWIFSTR